jgi:hypothetical protein
MESIFERKRIMRVYIGLSKLRVELSTYPQPLLLYIYIIKITKEKRKLIKEKRNH